MELAQLLPPQSIDSDPALVFEAELESAAHALDLDPCLLQRIKYPEREIAVHIPVISDNGSAMTVAAYRIQHSHAAGPSIGPICISPTSHPMDLRLAAAVLTLQSALLHLPLGGAAGAIVCDASRVSERGMRCIVSEYIRELRDSTGPRKDILTPDGPAWLLRAIRHANQGARGQYDPATVVGDAVLRDAIGSATVTLIREALHADDLSHVRVAIQGFGRAGRTVAEALDREHARIVAVADRSGAVIRSDGLDLTALAAYADGEGVVFGYPNAEPATNTDLLELDCDVLVLAAAAQQVGTHNASHVRARSIVEFTQNAVAVPQDSLPPGCLLVPYLVAGCPQLAVWAYEWQRGLACADLDPRQAADEAGSRVVAAFHRVRALSTEHGISVGAAAITLALQRLSTLLAQ